MLAVFNQLKKLDWILLATVLLLVAVGLLFIFGISIDDGLKIFKKQIFYFLIGIAAMLSFAVFNYRIFRDNNFFLLGLYFLGLLALVGVLLFGREVRGVSSWISIGQFGFEPVELVKIIIVLILAKYFSLRHVEVYRLKHLIVSGLYLLVPLVLILLQPELGYVLIMTLVWLAMVVVAGIKFKHILILSLMAIIIISASWLFVLKDYQKDRVVSFINPNLDPLGHGYNAIQSTIAIGSGQFFGRGLGYGTQSQLNFLPEQHTDFIFAMVAEEWGFVGSLFILLLFGILFYRLVKISLDSSNNFARLFTMGTAIMLLAQVIINIGMNVGLLPIVGIPLPFISYGGSSLVTGFMAIGIVQSIAIRNKN